MNLQEAIISRHSVRNYKIQKIDEECVKILENEIEKINEGGKLHFSLCLDEPKAFSGIMAKYGSFNGVNNYFVLAGKPSKNLDEACGYYGEKLVILAQTLGLNTCWVALTYNKKVCAKFVKDDEKLVCTISLGYGETQGVARKTKSFEKLTKSDREPPNWFVSGVNAAMLAPTAMNQQKFFLELKENTVSAKALTGFYSKLDLGIVKYHFEVGANDDGWKWSD